MVLREIIDGLQMLIGYARTSTVEQVAGLEAQEAALVATGCSKLFVEQVSSVARRDQLDAALEWVREGDTLVVTRLDRLARSEFQGHNTLLRPSSCAAKCKAWRGSLALSSRTSRIL